MTATGPADAQPLPPRSLRRSDDRVLAGVCGGVGQYLGINPNIVRVVALLLLVMGEGVFLYLAAWLLLPDAQGPSAFDRWRARRRG